MKKTMMAIAAAMMMSASMMAQTVRTIVRILFIFLFCFGLLLSSAKLHIIFHFRSDSR